MSARRPRRPIWTCPRCGARLVTPRLWHSCGRFSLEALFARSTPEALALARACVKLLRTLGDVQVLPQKTRLVCVARVRFAGLTPRRDHLVASFALHRWLDSPRVARHEDYGPRWRIHHVPLRSPAELDGELRTWLRESHDVVGMQAGLRPAPRRSARRWTPRRKARLTAAARPGR